MIRQREDRIENESKITQKERREVHIWKRKAKGLGVNPGKQGMATEPNVYWVLSWFRKKG